MDDDQGQGLSCKTCGAKVNSPEELDTHNKDAHGGGEGGAEGGTESGGESGGDASGGVGGGGGQ